jgi:FMN phosphatase YigB (HAD superfamily)
VGKPVSLFRLLVRQCDFLADKREIFAKCRVIAEQKAYEQYKAKTTLDDIYIQLERLLGLPAESLKLIQGEEINIEKKLAIPIPSTAAILADERKKGKHIAFVSDMYMSSKVIQDLLESAKIWETGDILLVSNMEGCDKASSLLFRRLKERCGLDGQKILHRGDNVKADFIGAKKAGCNAFLEKPAKLNRYEEIMENYSAKTNGFSSLLAGISRAVRLAHFKDDEHDQTIIRIAAGVVSPLLIAYVYWILKESCRLGLRTLYFASRDGEVLLAVAEQLSAAFEEFHRIELRYFYGSRHAWYPPSIKTAEDLEEAFSTWLFEGTADQTLAVFFSRLNIEIEDIKELLIQFDLSMLLSKTNLSSSDKSRLKIFLLSHDVLSFILSRSSQYRDSVLAYLRQEGLAGKKKWGFVDIGWKGRLQQKLSTFVSEIGGCLPVGFYFALVSYPSSSRYGAYCAYLSLNNFTTTSVVHLLETFCSGSHGIVLGYGTDESGVVRPCLQQEKNEAFHRWGLSCYRNAIMEFCAYLQSSTLLEQQWDFDKNMLVSLVDTFGCRPMYNEVKVWGAFVLSDDQKETTQVPLAGKLQFKDVIGEFLPRRYRLKFLWVEGTLTRSTFVMKCMYVNAHWFARTLESLIRKPIRLISKFMSIKGLV